MSLEIVGTVVGIVSGSVGLFSGALMWHKALVLRERKIERLIEQVQDMQNKQSDSFLQLFDEIENLNRSQIEIKASVNNFLQLITSPIARRWLTFNNTDNDF